MQGPYHVALHIDVLSASYIVCIYILVYISYAAVIIYKMIPSKLPLVFFLQRAPPRKFYVMRQAVMIGCQTSRRSLTVGVSHVALASAWRSLVASLAYSEIWHRNRKTERSSTSHKIGVADFCLLLKLCRRL